MYTNHHPAHSNAALRRRRRRRAVTISSYLFSTRGSAKITFASKLVQTILITTTTEAAATATYTTVTVVVFFLCIKRLGLFIKILISFIFALANYPNAAAASDKKSLPLRLWLRWRRWRRWQRWRYYPPSRSWRRRRRRSRSNVD